jgi:RNA polymerase sigma factor (sigma-70 family)
MNVGSPLGGYAISDLRTREQFEAATADCYDRVVRAVYLATGDAGAAEDAVQEALAKAWLRRRSIRNLPAYLTQASLNQSRSTWRKRQRELVTEPGALTDSTAPDGDRSLRQDLRVALLALPQRQREAIVLHDYLGFTFEEASQILGTSPEGLRNAAFHGRAQLRSRIPHLGGDTTDAD